MRGFTTRIINLALPRTWPWSQERRIREELTATMRKRCYGGDSLRIHSRIISRVIRRFTFWSRLLMLRLRSIHSTPIRAINFARSHRGSEGAARLRNIAPTLKSRQPRGSRTSRIYERESTLKERKRRELNLTRIPSFSESLFSYNFRTTEDSRWRESRNVGKLRGENTRSLYATQQLREEKMFL